MHIEEARSHGSATHRAYSKVAGLQSQMGASPVLRIQPSRGWHALDLASLWHNRELLYFFLWRDFKIRYRQTALGASWAIIQPLFAMLVFTVFFGRLARIPSDGIPYPLFSFVALVPWTFFANGVSKGSGSLVNNAALIGKVYLPRLLIPSGAVLSGIVDLAVALLMLLGLAAYYRVPATLNVLWLPLFLILALISALGVVLWLSALNVRFRDINYIVPFMVQLWLFASPVVYPSSLIPARWRTLYGLNPMVGVIEGFRWALLGSGMRPGAMTAVSSVVAATVLISGAFYFRRVEDNFADVV